MNIQARETERRKSSRFGMLAIVGLLLAALSGTLLGGSLDAPAGPTNGASAMYTLTDLYNLINNGTRATQRWSFVEPSAGPTAGTGRTLIELYNLARQRARVPKTGQMTSDAIGDDGYHYKGVAWPTTRFTDNGNGTVTDNLTGLIWCKNANIWGAVNWTTALTKCNNLANGTGGLTDGSIAWMWRLPNRRELLSLIDDGQVNPALPSGHPFQNVQSDYFWSSTGYALGPVAAWYVYLYDGSVSVKLKENAAYVWPVRGGQ